MRIGRACAAAAMTAAAALGAAGSAPAATKWLCGPGVANDPCRPSLSTTLYRGWDVRAGRFTPRRDRDRGVDCFYVYPTVSNQPTRLATKRVDPEIRSIALYQAARFSQVCRVYAPVYRQATVPALQAGTTTRGGLPDGLRRRRGGLRRVPAPHRPPPRLRPDRPLAGQLPPAAAHPPADRQPRRRCAAGWCRRCCWAATSPSARDRTAAACSAACPPASGRPSSRACSPSARSTRRRPTRRSSAAARAASPASSGCPTRPELETACTNPAALGSNRSVPLTSVVPTEPFAPGTLIAAGISLLGLEWPTRVDDVRAERRRVHRPLLARGRRARAPDRLRAGDAGSEGLADAGLGPAPRRRQHRPGRPREGPAAPDPHVRGPLGPSHRGRSSGPSGSSAGASPWSLIVECILTVDPSAESSTSKRLMRPLCVDAHDGGQLAEPRIPSGTSSSCPGSTRAITRSMSSLPCSSRPRDRSRRRRRRCRRT